MNRTEMQVLHQDDALLVLNKPSGLLSVPGKGPDKQDCLSAQVQQWFPDALVVHRLDMATSGLMVMARGESTQRTLNKAFASREVSKRYVAVVDGVMGVQDNAWSEIDFPIIVDWPNRPLRVIDAQQGQPSLTRWRVHAGDTAHCERRYPTLAGTTRLELQPVTGRSHQLRVHLKAMGYAIVGDALYADLRVQTLADRLLLHACELTLCHPITGETCTFQSPAPF